MFKCRKTLGPDRRGWFWVSVAMPSISMMTDAKQNMHHERRLNHSDVPEKLSSTQYWRTASIWSARRFLFNVTSLRVFLVTIFDGSDGCIRPWSCKRLVTRTCGAWMKRGRNTAALFSIQQTWFPCSSWGSAYPLLRGEFLQMQPRRQNGNDDSSLWFNDLHQQPSAKSKYKHQQLHN